MHVVIGNILIYIENSNQEFFNLINLILIGCRKISAGESAIAEIRKGGVDTGSSVVFECDTSSIESTKKFAERVLQSCPKVHILINNGNFCHRDSF